MKQGVAVIKDSEVRAQNGPGNPSRKNTEGGKSIQTRSRFPKHHYCASAFRPVCKLSCSGDRPRSGNNDLKDTGLKHKHKTA